jgi:hypothetical protein
MSDILQTILGGASKRLKDMGDGSHAEVMTAARAPVGFSNAAGSPFTLTASWAKVATTTGATRGLRIAPLADAAVFDIEWVAVAAGAAAPSDTYGEPVLGGEDFASGIPLGDIYLKSASGQKAVVRVGA